LKAEVSGDDADLVDEVRFEVDGPGGCDISEEVSDSGTFTYDWDTSDCEAGEEYDIKATAVGYGESDSTSIDIN